MAFELSTSPILRPDAAELVAAQAPPRLHNLWAAFLCGVLTVAIGATAWWIQAREAVFRAAFVEFRSASVERSLLAADAHMAQLVAQADAIMLPALWALGGRDPGHMTAEQLATLHRVSLEVVPGRFTLDFWCPDGTNALRRDRPNAAGLEFFRYQMSPDRLAPERALLVDSYRGLFFATPRIDPATGQPTIHIARPILDPDGATNGVVSVGIPLAAVSDFLMALRDRTNDRIALYRNDRALIAQYPAESAIGIADTPHEALWHLYPAAGFGKFERPAGPDRAGTLTVFFGLRPMPLVLVYTIEWHPLTRAVLAVYWPILAIAAATLAAAVVYAWMSIRYADALFRTNTELALAKEHLRFESDERGIFIANMNHELRTPLNAIVGFAQILAEATFGPAHPKYREYARDIASSGQHLQALIGEIIDFSAIDQGRRKLEIVRLNTQDAIAEIVRLLRPVAGDRRVALVESGAAVAASGDPVAVRQILINLVANAIKFSAAGSTVEIESRIDPATGFVAVSVIDHGSGISLAELASIGRPFFRTRAARLGAVSGTGLGLSISVALAQQMGGRLTLSSVPGIGTTVTLLLPPDETN